MQIGKYEAHLIDAGKYRLDGGAMFGVVPRLLWEKKNPPDDSNRILLALNTFLLIRDCQVILIDSGIGDKFEEKYQQIYAVDYSEHSLIASLATKNVRPEDVTDVIITHLHFDHVGGTTYFDDDRNLKLRFPNATHYLQKKQLEWALKGFPKDRASYLTENIEPLRQSQNIKLIDGPQKLFEGIEVMLSDGHTTAQQMVLISGQNEKLIYTADLIPTAAHIPIPWVMAYDLFPVKTIEEKTELLKTASDEEWLILFEHDPWNYCGLVEKGDRGFTLKESVAL